MSANSATVTGEPRDATPRPASARPDTAALIEGLDRLRDILFHHLDQIEVRAREQAEQLEMSPPEREQELRERVAFLEAAQARLHAESKRREQEWSVLLEQLENDRRMIAEAWEKLEQERIGQPAGPPATHPASEPDRAPNAATAALLPQSDPAGDAVAKAVLRQFQSLQSDVRRSAKERKGR
jgi:hypothetical protein